MLSELATQLVVAFLASRFALQLVIALANNLLQVAPSVFQRFHGEPCVRVWSYSKLFDATIQVSQLAEILLGGRQRLLI